MLKLPEFYTPKTPDELYKYLRQHPGTPIYYHDDTGADVELGRLSSDYFNCDSSEKYVFFEGIEEDQSAELPHWPLAIFFALLAHENTTPLYLFRCAQNCSRVESLTAKTPLKAFECSSARNLHTNKGRAKELLHLPKGYLSIRICSVDDVNSYLIIETRPPVRYDELDGM